MTYWTKYGLLKRHVFEPPSIENEFLFGLVYYILGNKEEKNKINQSLRSFIAAAFFLRGGKFVAKNHIDPNVLLASPKISHDQLTAYSSYSVLTKRGWHAAIWDGIKWFKYDGRFLHPRDMIYYWGLNNPCMKHVSCFMLLPFMLFTFARKYTRRKGKKFLKTSEAHMYLVRTTVIDVGWFAWIYVQLCTFRFGGVDGMLLAYYKEEEHPILN